MKNVVRWHGEKFICLTHHWTFLTFFALHKRDQRAKNVVVWEKLWRKLFTDNFLTAKKRTEDKRKKLKIVKLIRRQKKGKLWRYSHVFGHFVKIMKWRQNRIFRSSICKPCKFFCNHKFLEWIRIKSHNPRLSQHERVYLTYPILYRSIISIN